MSYANSEHRPNTYLVRKVPVVYGGGEISENGVFQITNVKNIYKRRRMSRVRIGGAGARRNVRLCRMQQRSS